MEYEDSFVKIAGLLGGEDYVKVTRALLNNENATDEEVASATGLKLSMVRKTLYDLFGRSLITGVRVRDPKRGWFVYQWRAQRDQVDAFIGSQRKKIMEKLTQRLEYERAHDFYHCGTPTCVKLPFEQAMDHFFKCPSCGKTVDAFDNRELIEALVWKIGDVKRELGE